MAKTGELDRQGSALTTPQWVTATYKLHRARILLYAMGCKGLIRQANTFNTALGTRRAKVCKELERPIFQDGTGARKASTYVTSSSASKVSIEGAQAKA